MAPPEPARRRLAALATKPDLSCRLACAADRHGRIHTAAEGTHLKLYLVQHGEAEPASSDPARPLTAGGRRDVQCVAAVAGRLGLEVQQIRHSGKLRAEQTAALFAYALSPPEGVIAVSGLGPKDAAAPVAEALEGESRPTMLVGHLPFMERLAALLITGDAERTAVEFRNGGIVCLTRKDTGWRVSWVLTPEMARAG